MFQNSRQEKKPMMNSSTSTERIIARVSGRHGVGRIVTMVDEKLLYHGAEGRVKSSLDNIQLGKMDVTTTVQVIMETE